MEFVRSGKVKAAAKSAREGLEGSERDELKRAEAKRASLTCGPRLRGFLFASRHQETRPSKN
jgi:hypothetical protein